MNVTQATISRDIKELHLIKEQTGRGSYHYAVSVHKETFSNAGRLRTIFRESVSSFDCAQESCFKNAAWLGICSPYGAGQYAHQRFGRLFGRR